MSTQFTETKIISAAPRFPSMGLLDLTYRCNNNCRHCWCIDDEHKERVNEELSVDTIKRIVLEARQVGCQHWYISGGEPMLRKDFSEILDFLSHNSRSYSLNTNGTCITPAIASLMKRGSANFVSLYGATKQIHDYITRNSGSFEATMRGMALLREAGAPFTVQIMPMRDNFHQYRKMCVLASTLSPFSRIGAPWLYLSASGDAERNKEIQRQRLSAEKAVSLISPSSQCVAATTGPTIGICRYQNGKHFLFSGCIEMLRNFHINPYGFMSFCSLIQDASLRYDLKKGNFQDGWFKFLPSLVHKVKGAQKYINSCGRCKLKGICNWCAAYGYLEHRRFDAKIDYFCKIAFAQHRRDSNWLRRHRRYYQVAGIAIRVDSDLAFSAHTFSPAVEAFRVREPTAVTELIILRHRFGSFDLKKIPCDTTLYKSSSWEVYKKGDNWVYVKKAKNRILAIVIFDKSHAHGTVYHNTRSYFLQGYMTALAVMLKDPVYLVPFLTQRQGCFFHACAVSFRGKGGLFLGPSGAGKSTLAGLLKGNFRILGDECIAIRKETSGIVLHGTWRVSKSHNIYRQPTPLAAIFFLKKSKENCICRITDKKIIRTHILQCLLRSLTTVEWWEQSLAFVEMLIREFPCYELRFDRSGCIAEKLREHFSI